MVERGVSITLPRGDSSGERTRGALLGPQRLGITIGRELESFGVTGKVAAITAGWQEREAEDEELDAAIGHRSVNLRLHARCEEVFEADTELFRAHRAKQDLLRKLQAIHRVRLNHAVQGTRELLVAARGEVLAEAEVESAFEHLRYLDGHHLRRLSEIQADFEAEVNLVERDEVQRHRAEIEATIAECEAVAIAGGHVALLLNRMRLFGLGELIAHKPLFAWSAGAMAVTERVVVFHDNPPQGAGNAEVVAPGLGLYQNLVVFPHAKRRLRLDDVDRVMLLGRRFVPATCIALDEWSGIRFRDDGPTAFGPARLLGVDGQVVEIEPEGLEVPR